MNQSIALMLFFFATVLMAGYVRGYGGFGFSMITVAALSLICPPAQVVPVVLLLEVAASLFLMILSLLTLVRSAKSFLA